MGLFPLAYFGEQAWQTRGGQGQSWRALVAQLGIFLLAFGLTISPQMVEWYGLYGQILVIPQPTAVVDSRLPIHFLDFFFSTNRGLLWWTPFVFLGLLGLFWAPERRLKILLVTYCVLQSLLIGYWSDWVSGGMFGQCFLLEMLPVIALGFVFLVERLRRLLASRPEVPARGLAWAGMGVVLLLVAHQLVLVYTVEHAIEPGWVDLAAYTQGQPLGVSFQGQAIRRLISEPGLWLALRPFVLDDRQALVVSLLQGNANLRTLAIPTIGVLLSPLVVLLVVGLRRFTLRERALPVIAGCGLALMLAWSLYLLTLV